MLEKVENTLELDRRAKILRCATTLFANYGLSGVSTRQISEAAGCNLAAISYYFGGKEKLYAECLNSIDPKVVEEFANILIPPGSRQELEMRLKDFCVSFCHFVAENSDSVKLLVNEMNANGQQYNLDDNFLKPIVDRLEIFFQDALRKGIIHPDIEIKMLTRTICSMIVTQILYRSFKPFEKISYQDFAHKIVRNCTGSFYV